MFYRVSVTNPHSTDHALIGYPDFDGKWRWRSFWPGRTTKFDILDKSYAEIVYQASQLGMAVSREACPGEH